MADTKKRNKPVIALVLILILLAAAFGGWKYWQYYTAKKADEAEYLENRRDMAVEKLRKEAESMAGRGLPGFSVADSSELLDVEPGKTVRYVFSDASGVETAEGELICYKKSSFNDGWTMFEPGEIKGLLSRRFLLQSDMELLVDGSPEDGVSAIAAQPADTAELPADGDKKSFAEGSDLKYYDIQGLFREEQCFVRLSDGSTFSPSQAGSEPEWFSRDMVMGDVLYYHPQADPELAKVIRASFSETLVRRLDTDLIKVRDLKIQGPVMTDYYHMGMYVESDLDNSKAQNKASDKYTALIGLVLGADGVWRTEYEAERTDADEALPEYLNSAQLTDEPVFQIPKPVAKQSPYYIKVNRLQNCVTIYGLDADGGYSVPVKAMVCSTGREGHETPMGNFAVQDFKAKWCYMVDGSYGQYATGFRSGGYLFHSICYTAKEHDAMMVDEYNLLGNYASLGCVRLQTADAKWIFDNCPVGTGVTVYEDENPGPLGKPGKVVAEITEEMNNGWDPTDPADGNPWRSE